MKIQNLKNVNKLQKMLWRHQKPLPNQKLKLLAESEMGLLGLESIKSTEALHEHTKPKHHSKALVTSELEVTSQK